MLLQQLRRDAGLHAEHQLQAFIAGFYRLWRKLRDAGDKADMSRHHQARGRVEHDACFATQCQQACLLGRQEEGHIDIGEVNHIQHPTAGGQHFARFGDAILNAAVAWRFEFTIVNIGKDAPFGCLSGINAGLGLNNAGTGGFNCRFCR